MIEFTEAEEKVIQGWESFSGESFDDLFWKDKRDFAVKILGLSEEQARDKIRHGRLLSDIIDIQDGVVVVAGQMIGDNWGQCFDDLDWISKRAYMFGNNMYCAELELDERNFEDVKWALILASLMIAGFQKSELNCLLMGVRVKLKIIY